jgi:hypothetical protein
MIQVDNINILNALKNHDEGELALVLDEQKMYQYHDGWQPYTPENRQLGLSIYEVNQQVVSQLPNLDADAIQNGINIINQYTQANSYYMLLCRDINYYTLFETGWDESDETVGEAVIDCFNYLQAELKAIDLTDGGEAVEIWFTIIEDQTPVAMCAYFFNYDEGVILCK